jgi:hypothetical protein
MKSQEVKWIDIDDSLPEKGQKVLCIQNPETTATQYPLAGIFNGKCFLCPEPSIYANFEIGLGCWSDVIYWMPLPKTPKQLLEENVGGITEEINELVDRINRLNYHSRLEVLGRI